MNDSARPLEPDSFVIELTVPAFDPFLQLVRSVVGRAAGMAGFTFDGIEDFALAVDEAATLLIERSGSALHLKVSGIEEGEVVALLDIGEANGWPPEDLASDTGWQVLSALCDRVWVLDEPYRHGIGLSQSIR